MIAGVVAYYASAARKQSYTADALVVVPSGAGPRGPGNASEAIKLAVTYAVLIPEDDRILRRLAAELKTTSGEIARRLVVFHDADTSLLRLRFKGPTPRYAMAGATAAARAVTSPTPSSPSIAKRSIALVSLPRHAESATSTPSTALAIGLVLGLALGLVAFVAWERSDPRITNVASLEAETGCPSSTMAQLSSESVRILLQRWEALGKGNKPTPIAILPVNEKLQPVAMAAARRLRDGGRDTSVAVDVAEAEWSPASAPAVGDASVILRAGAAPGSSSAGEAVALDSDVVVLVAAPGTSVADVRNVEGILRRLGIKPDWALLAPARFSWDERPQDQEHVGAPSA